MKAAYYYGLALAGIAVAGWIGFGASSEVPQVKQMEGAAISDDTPREMVQVILPDLGSGFAIGARAFTAKCAACHGPSAGGLDGVGPPLIHKIYEPSHHADAAFFRAAEVGGAGASLEIW